MACSKYLTSKDDKAPKTFSLVPQEMTTLSRIFKTFTASPETTRQQYGNDLEASLEALIHDRKVNKKPKRTPFAGGLGQAIAQSLQALHDHVSAIRASLSDGEAGFRWLNAGNLWPCLSPVMLLEQLRHSNQSYSSPKMRKELLLYGVLFTNSRGSSECVMPSSAEMRSGYVRNRSTKVIRTGLLSSIQSGFSLRLTTTYSSVHPR
ncbi:hypothetical protein NW759_012209 [Fusarium solani]|nr:hypothetical protein NW759_012209 [Fusarium solani]